MKSTVGARQENPKTSEMLRGTGGAPAKISEVQGVREKPG